MKGKKMSKILFCFLCLSSFGYGKGEVDLDASIITGTSFKESLEEISTNVFVIDKEDILKKGYTSVTDILRNIPSIQIQNIGGSSVIDIRGEGLRAKNTVKILVDGVPLNYPITAPVENQGNTELESIPIDTIEKIEILPSGGTILYGDNSSGGVINIITDKTLDKDYKVSFFARSEENDLTKGLTVGKKIGKLTTILNYSEKNKTENYYFGKEDVKNFSSNLNYKLSDNTNMSLIYSKYEDEKNILQPLTKEEFDNEIASSEKPIYYKTDKDSINYKLSTKINDKLDLNVDLGYSDIDSNTEIDASLIMPIPNANGTMKGDFKDDKINFSPKLKYSVNDNLNITTGYSYENVKSERTLDIDATGHMSMFIFTFDPKVNINQHFNLTKESHAGFIKAKYKVGNLVISPGYRYEFIHANFDQKGRVNVVGAPPIAPIKSKDIYNEYSKDYNLSTFELGAAYNYRDTGKLYYNFIMGEDTPSINKYINNDFASGNTFVLNNNLENEKYVKNEIGIRDYFYNSLVSIALFDIRKKDEIAMNGVAPRSWEYYNMENTKRKGIEFNATQFFNKITLKENLTYIDSKIKDSKIKGEEGKEIPYVSDFVANVGITYKINENLNTTLSGNYRSSYRTGQEYNGNYIEMKSDSYITFDWGMNILYNNLTLNIGVNNIFNEKNMESIKTLQKGDFVSGISVEKSYLPGAERTYYVGFKYDF